MLISEYIKDLKAIKKEHGDIPVTIYSPRGDVRRDRIKPEVKFTKKKTGREYLERYWDDYMGLDSKGEKVVKL